MVSGQYWKKRTPMRKSSLATHSDTYSSTLLLTTHLEEGELDDDRTLLSRVCTVPLDFVSEQWSGDKNDQVADDDRNDKTKRHDRLG